MTSASTVARSTGGKNKEPESGPFGEVLGSRELQEMFDRNVQLQLENDSAASAHTAEELFSLISGSPADNSTSLDKVLATVEATPWPVELKPTTLFAADSEVLDIPSLQLIDDDDEELPQEEPLQKGRHQAKEVLADDASFATPTNASPVSLISSSANSQPVRNAAAEPDETLLLAQEEAKSLAREVKGLRETLTGKEELISALVAELEQVVEQLDRAQRNGDRSGPTHASMSVGQGGSTAVGNTDDDPVQRMASEWETLKPADVLGRIESEVLELRRLLSSGLTLVPAAETQGVSETAPPTTPSTDTASGSWESIKRRMLGEPDVVESTPALSDNASVHHSLTDQEQRDSENVSGTEIESLESILSIPMPKPVDITRASIEALRVAVDERDVCIVHLSRAVRSRRQDTIPQNWDDIEGIPDQLRSRVEELITRLEEQVRLAEVEMSLDRARLSREKGQFQADQEVINKHMKRLGIKSLDELDGIVADNGSNTDRRWMRFLGVNRR